MLFGTGTSSNLFSNNSRICACNLLHACIKMIKIHHSKNRRTSSPCYYHIPFTIGLPGRSIILMRVEIRLMHLLMHNVASIGLNLLPILMCILSRVYAYCHSLRIGKNEYSLRILRRNHWYGSHLHLFTKRMLRKCKKLFLPPFSRTQNTTFSRQRMNVSPDMENTHKHPFTLIIFAIRSRLFSANVDKCKPGFIWTTLYDTLVSSLYCSFVC